MRDDPCCPPSSGGAKRRAQNAKPGLGQDGLPCSPPCAPCDALCAGAERLSSPAPPGAKVPLVLLHDSLLRLLFFLRGELPRVPPKEEEARDERHEGDHRD